MKKKETNYADAPVTKSIPAFVGSSGKIVDLMAIKAEDITIEDIANALSKLARYNGHTDRFYSVAEHSVRLSNYANNLNLGSHYNKSLAKALLLHDATEYLIGDIIFHLKGHLPQFKEMEVRLEKVIFDKFGITPIYDLVKKELHELDRRISFDEMYTMFDGKVDPWFYENRVSPLGPKIMLGPQDSMGWTPEQAKLQFLAAAEYFGLYTPPKAVEDVATPPAVQKKKRTVAKKKKPTTKKKVKK